jgi:hypothetical protein
MRVVLMVWHAFLFLVLRFFSSFLLFARWSPLLFLVTCFFEKALETTQHVVIKGERRKKPHTPKPVYS